MVIDNEKVFLLGSCFNSIAARCLMVALAGGHLINFIAKESLNFDGSIYGELSTKYAPFAINVNLERIPSHIRQSFLGYEGVSVRVSTDPLIEANFVLLKGLIDLGLVRFKIDYEYLKRVYGISLRNVLDTIERSKDSLSKDSYKYVVPEDGHTKSMIDLALKLKVLKEEQIPFMYRVARTIACLSNSGIITSQHVAESIQYVMGANGVIVL